VVFVIYVVERGDTLWAIARALGVSQARLRSDNGLAEGEVLVPGQALVVCVPTETYTVREGDSLYRIAGETGLSVRQLLQLNPAVAQTLTVYPGEQLALRLAEEGGPRFTVNGYAYPHTGRYPLRGALPFLTDLSVFSYGFREDGSLIVPEDADLLDQAREFGAGAVLVLTSIDESGHFNTDHAARLFRDRNLQKLLFDSLLLEMTAKGYRGLDADFEYIQEDDADAYFAFLGYARDRLHEARKFLQVALAPKTYADQPGMLYAAHSYPIIGDIADQVLLMTYEWGYAYGPPMAVAPLPQVERVLRYGVSEISPEKIQMGIPNYGYDWTLPYDPARRAVTLGNREAVRLAAQVGAEIQFDETAQSPTFSYRRAGEDHVVWFEDARSIRAKVALAASLGLGGLGYWNLLRPFPQNWALLSQEIVVEGP
jgi:spore germination protein